MDSVILGYFGLFLFILVYFGLFRVIFGYFGSFFFPEKAVLTIFSDFRFQPSGSSPKTTYKTGSGNKTRSKLIVALGFCKI